MSEGIPVLREFVELSDSRELLAQWWHGWTSTGLGADRPAPTSYFAAGAAQTLSLGATGLLRTVSVLALVPLGAWGAWRLLAGVGSRWGRLGVLIAYVAAPLPYDALAEGRLAALVLYAAAPWLLRRLLTSSEVAPFGPIRRSARHDGVLLAVIASVAAVFAPLVLAVLVGMTVVVGGVLAASGNTAGARRVGVVGGVGVVIGALVNLPDLITMVGAHSPVAAFAGARGPLPAELELSDLVRLSDGTAGGGLLLAAVSFVALLVLVVGRSWRLRWAAVGWGLAVGAWAVIAVATRFAPEVAMPSLAALLVPALLGLALAVGMSVESTLVDVLGGEFGWRQVLAGLAAVVAAVGVVPAVIGTADGRWDAPVDRLGRHLGNRAGG